jgi:hypothetical protein
MLPSDYESEFIAYWNDRYTEEDIVNLAFLSFVDKVTKNSEVFCLSLDQPWFGGYKYILCSTTEQLAAIQNILANHGLTYQTNQTFHIGIIDNLSPPFHITNGQIKEYLLELGLFENFKEYLETIPFIPMITFSIEIDEREILLGWIPETHEYSCYRNRLQRPQKISYLSADHPENPFGIKGSKKIAERISPEVFTRERLVWRTQGNYKIQENNSDLNVLIAGLGSIGSHLLSMLIKNKNISSYKLIDHDTLKLENIYRHLLGFSYIGQYKVSAINQYVQGLDPLLSISTRKEKIISVINNEPKYIHSCDYCFFCTGDVNSEDWIANYFLNEEENVRAFFIWVEPFLAGGHCLYICDRKQIDWNALFPDHIFFFNTISKSMHSDGRFTLRENGCNTSFTPYGGGYIYTFLGMLYPKILEIFASDSTNRCFSWIGDLDFLSQNGIKLSEILDGNESFSIVERDIT